MRTGMLIAVLWLCVSCWAGTVTGRVFVDANGDGAWQAGEEGLGGVVVSDGAAVVETAADGQYTLETADGEQDIFVVNPTDTWFEGPSWRRVKVGPAQADFPLVRQQQRVPFTFVQGTDLHIRPEIADKMAQYVAAVNALPIPVAFVVHTGDLVADVTGLTVPAARALLAAYQKMVAGLRAPLINLPGNHEHAAAARPDVPTDTPGWGKEAYREMLGPTWFAFTYAGVQFLALDGTDVSTGRIVYGIPRPCLDWLRAYLAHVPMEARIVVLIHEPLNSLAQKAEVESLLAGRKVILALSGHGHAIATWPFAGATEIMGGITGYAWHGGGYGYNPLGYHVVRITDTGFQDGFGDWAAKYSLTVREPKRGATLNGPVTVKAAILDPAAEVERVHVRLGANTATVSSFETEGLNRTFAVNLDASSLADGFYDLAFDVEGQYGSETERQPFLVLTGTADATTFDAPATLKLRLRGANAADSVLVNGKERARSEAGKALQTLTIPIPADELTRLTTVEVVTAKTAAGTWDQVDVDLVTMQYKGTTTCDFRRGRTGVVKLRSNGNEPARGTWYLDVTRPDDYGR